MDFDWKALVRTVAPGIASVFGTPLAGMGVTAILNAILPADAPRPAQNSEQEQYLAQMLQSANPEILFKIKQADQAFALEIKRLNIDLDRLTVADRDSARKREVDTKDSTTRNLAWVYTIGYFGMLAALMGGYVHVPPAHDGLLDVLMGVLTAGQYSVLSYYFGSSHGSATKDQTIDRVVNHNG